MLRTWNGVPRCNMMTSQQIQYGGRPPYWKTYFGYISALYCSINAKFWYVEAQSCSGTGLVTKLTIFENSRWRTAAILKIVLWLYLSRKSSDFNEIWYADADCVSRKQNTNILQIQNGGRPPYWKSSFGYISTNDYPINAKFFTIKQNHVLTQVIWPKYQISKIQDGGRPPFWKWVCRYISAGNHPI